MADETNVQDEQKKEDVQDEQHSDLEKLDAGELVSIIKDLRSEAKSRRLKASELQSKLDEIKAKEDKAKEDELKKKGDYEKLLAEKESQIAQLSDKAKAFDEYRETKVNSTKELLGESWLDEYSKLSIAALERLGQTMSKQMQVKINVDDPNKKAKTPVIVELTDAQKKEALRMFPARKDEDAFELYKGFYIKQLERKQKEK